MAHSRKDEARALDAAELELVEKSHHPAIQDLSDAELSDLTKHLRERRDKAQSTANRQRREMRRKTEAKGVRASADDSGTRRKTEVLAMAVRRLNGERDRRNRMAARAELVENAQNALSMRQAAEGGKERRTTRSAGKGMRASESTRARKVTAPKKVGSVSQQNKRAQAKRDA